MNRRHAVAGLLWVLVILTAAHAGAAQRTDPAEGADGGPAAVTAPASSEEVRRVEDFESRRIFEESREDGAAAVTSPPYVDMLKLGASLAIVLGLVAAAAWAFRRLMPRTSSMFSGEVVKVLARSYLGPRQAVSLVSVGGKLLVVGSTQTTVTALAEIDDPEEVSRIKAAVAKDSSHGATETFKNILSTVTGRRAKGAAFDEEVAAAVSEVSDRVAVLNRRLETYERDLN